MEEKMKASSDLEKFIDESIRISKRHDYHPTNFIRMRERHGTLEAITRLVCSGDIQSGFKKMQQLGLLEWTIEEAVIKHPCEFAKGVREAAEWRLKQAGKSS